MPARLFRSLFSPIFVLAIALVGPAVAQAAAPHIALFVVSPQTAEPDQPMIVGFMVENDGNASFNGPITLQTTFSNGIGVTSEEVEFQVPISNHTTARNCSFAGQTVTCTVDITNNLTGEGLLPGGSFYLFFSGLRVKPTAAGALVDRTTVEGGGAFEVATHEETITVGPPNPFGFRNFENTTTNLDGSTAVQAGSSPGALATTLSITSKAMPIFHFYGISAPTEQIRNTVTHVPPGVIGNPNATPEKCTALQLNLTEFGGCPPSSQVGYVRLFNSATVPLYNMATPPGVPAQFGFVYIFVPTLLRAQLRPDYSLDVVNRNAVISEPLTDVSVVFWGVPADPAHDAMRSEKCLKGGKGQTGELCPAGYSPTAFLRLPTSCPDHPLTWEIEANSYFHPETWVHASDTTPAPQGCNQLEFTPTIEARPTTDAADSPSGLDFHLHLPQNDDPEGLAEANLRDAVVTLPQGLTINPASANGLGACSPSQIGLTSDLGSVPARFTIGKSSCPDPSRLGSVEIDTPVIDHPLKGSAYLATPYQNPYDSLIALYFEVDDPLTGIFVKIPARIAPDPETGRVRAIVAETPQLPFEDFHMEFDPGPHASLRTPATCGTFTSTSDLTPWTSPEGADKAPGDDFAIRSGAAAGPCSAAEDLLPQSAGFDAGTLNPKAGAYTPFALKIARPDGSQPLRSIDATLPSGLLARLVGVDYCSEAALAAAAAKTGAAELASPSCPAASRVGSVDVGAGAGPSPFYTHGEAYLTGPYRGAPYSLVVIVPAVAGPFDLGTVLVRTALYIDPTTTRVRALSDPLPQILQGIPLDVRSVALNLDRPNFTLNPTSCDPTAVTAALGSPFGHTLAVSSPFQLGGCRELGFKPRLGFRFSGGTNRRGHPAIRAVLRPRPGDANIARVSVALPPNELLDNAHIGNICTRVQYNQGAGGGASCPPSSRIGSVTAYSPLLAYPLYGGVYLRSSEHDLPDLVASLGGQIHVDVVSRVDSTKQGGLRNTFEAIPDAPLTKAVFTLQGGKKGLVQNSKSLCADTYRASVRIDAHNGMTHDSSPKIEVAGCRGRSHRRGSKHRR